MFHAVKTSLFTILFLTSLILSGAAIATPAQAAVSLDGVESRIQTLTNKSRAAHDKSGLSRSKCLQRFAQKQADRQAAQKSMFHQDLKPILKACGLSFVGENVAYGYTSPAAVQKAWMRSPGHRANILHPRFRMAGVGVSAARDGTLYYAVVFGRS